MQEMKAHDEGMDLITAERQGVGGKGPEEPWRAATFRSRSHERRSARGWVCRAEGEE